MSEKVPCIKISVPTFVSYTLGMTFRNTFVKMDPKIQEYLNMKPVPHASPPQNISIINIIDLINQGKLDPEDSDSECESD